MTLRLGSMSLPVPDSIGLLAALLVVIGSIGPWATRWGEYFDGTKDVVYINGTNGDGQVSLAIGILAGVLILSRLFWLRPSTASTIALAGAILLSCGFRLDWSVQLVGNIALSGSETRRRIFLARVRRRLGNHGRDRRRFRRGRCLGLPDVERPFSVTLSYPAKTSVQSR